MAIESHSPALVRSPREALPGLATALDEHAIRGYVETALFGSASTYTVERSRPTRPLYLPGEACVVRYRVRARDGASGALLEPLVIGRVFPDRSACARYVRERLEPLAQRMRDRPEVAVYTAPVAEIDELNMAVHVWPIDGELPTLVDATDRRRMLDVLREELPRALREPFEAEDCDVEPVSYRRRQRCVLRYTVSGRGGAAGGGETRRVVLYGKVSASGNELLVAAVIDALGRRIPRTEPLALPRSFGARPELALSLLEALHGEARIAPALTARLRGRETPDGLALEDLIATAARVAALLHGSGVALGATRTLQDELDGLRPEVAAVAQFAPRFADRATSWLERIAALGAESEPLGRSLCHGDFKHEQLLFDGRRAGLVDLDGVCQAEPALDLGKFLAHLRTEVRRAETRASVSSTLADELGTHFLHTYIAFSGNKPDEPRFEARTALYEAVALVRLALRAHQDLDEGRVETATDVLEQRMCTLAAETPSRRGLPPCGTS